MHRTRHTNHLRLVAGKADTQARRPRPIEKIIYAFDGEYVRAIPVAPTQEPPT